LYLYLPDDEVGETPEDYLDAWTQEVRFVAVSGYRLILDDGPDLSDSSDEGNRPDEEKDVYTPGSSIGTVRLTEEEAQFLGLH
jgi:hypothetical protein